MANQHSFDLSTLAAGDLTGMVTAMVKQLGETKDRWDKVVDTAKTHGPDNPKDGSLLKDWSNIIHIKGVVSDIMSAHGMATHTYHTSAELSAPRQLTSPPRMNSMTSRTDPPIAGSAILLMVNGIARPVKR